MRKITLILVFVVGALQAQQFSLPSQIDRNLLYVNPAYTGALEAAVLGLMHRSQWVNMPGALSFQNLEFHAPLKKQSMALGFQARNESIGLKNTTEAFIDYAFRIRTDKAILALALKAGVQSISYQDATLPETTQDNDLAFAANSTLLPNGGFGLSYYNPRFYIGLAVPYFFGSISDAEGNAQLDFNIDRLEYVLTTGGSWRIGYNLRWEPVLGLYYSTTLKPHATLIMNFKYLDRFILGAGYRHPESLIFNAAYYLNLQFSIGYSYDYNIGDIGAYSSGSHEIGLLYYFGYKVNSINPRDF
jgi:type IX secretion system PorP/SprF family membrane protein